MGATEHDEGYRLQGLDAATVYAGKSDALGRFFLALALAYNDLKTLMGLWHGRNQTIRQPPDWSEFGDLNGTGIMITRQMIALCHELIRLIEKHSLIVDSPEMRRLVDELDPTAQRNWEDVVEVALGRGERQTPFRRFLGRVRGGLTSHYYNPDDLVRGFETAFLRSAPEPLMDRPYVSLGDSMATTRFFYADAAAHIAIREIWASHGVEGYTLPEINQMINKVNIGVFCLLREFLVARAGQAKSPEAP